MEHKPPTARKRALPQSRATLKRQLIACAVALGIVGLGAWSLLGQSAPYHPEVDDTGVTRNASGITDAVKGN